MDSIMDSLDSNATTAEISTESSYAASVVSREPWYSAFVCLYILLSVAVVFGTWLIITAYWTMEHLQTTSNLLIANLSLIDGMVALFSIPFVIFNYTESGLWFVFRRKWVCLTSLFMTTSAATASMMAVLFVSIERFIAVICPYAYYRTVTDRSVKVANIAAMGLPVCLHIIPFFGWHAWKEGLTCVTMHVHNPIYNSCVVSGSRVVILLAAAILNIIICFVAFKKRKAHPPAAENTGHDFKLTKMMLTVVGVFYLCWAPYLGLTVYYTMKEGPTPVWLMAAQDFSILGVGLNSALNPLIYASKCKKFNAAFKKILSMKENL